MNDEVSEVRRRAGKLREIHTSGGRRFLVLKGTPAGTVPVVSAESYFELNYRAARELGLEASEGMVSRADKVIR